MKLITFFLIGIVFNSCENTGQSVSNTDTQIPQDAPQRTPQIILQSPPYGFQCFEGWLQAVTLVPGEYNDGYVQVDWMKIVEKATDGGESDVYFEDYTNFPERQLDTTEGALYARYPSWFANNHLDSMSNSIVKNGYLYVYAGQTPDRVCHWWTQRINWRPSYTYYIEIRANIHGNVAIQLGADFWKDITSGWCGLNLCNSEAHHGKWSGNTNGSFKIFRSIGN